jgi:ABC-2 type transport system permease protein
MQGLSAVFRKELCDHFSSNRFVILFALIAMVSFITSYMAALNLRSSLDTLSQIQFPFLMLFSRAGALFSMVQFVAFFGPLIGLVLGFDSINRERAHGTLTKLISQPIYRDAVINGKFLADVATISIMLTAIVLVISAFGLALVGVVPGIEQIWRIIIYLAISIFYISFWLGIAILFSICFRSIATSALASVALWIFLSFFISLGAEVVGDAVAPVSSPKEARVEEVLKNARVKRAISFSSPMVLYNEATRTIINPMEKPTPTALPGFIEGILASRFQNPLSLTQSMLVVFPHVTALVAITLLCFAISYLVFMLQEIRT